MEITHDITIEELYIPSKHDKESYLCENFIVYPEGKEQSGGYLLGLIEIRATEQSESDKIIKIIVNTLKEQYYNAIKTSPDPQKLNLETVFEHALQKTNEAVMEMIQIGHISFALENLNYIIAAAKPNDKTKEIDFLFCHQGLVQAYLLHKTKQNNYKVINIIDNTPKLKDDPNKIKIFSSILSGKIYFHDAIYICSEIFNNYIPANKVNKILFNNDLRASLDYFKNLINNVRNNSFLTYSAIFVKLEEKKAIIDKPISQKSIANLMNTKDVTEKYLTPTFALNLRDYINKFFNLFKRSSDKKLQGPKKERKLRLTFLSNLGGWLIGSIRKLLKRKHKENSSKETNRKKFPKINATLIIVVVALVAVLVGSVFWIRHSQAVKQQAAEYASQLKTIRDNINSSQVNFIYKNESQSLRLIKQAEIDVQKLSQKNNNETANYAELVRQIDTIKGKLLKIEKVVPQLVIELNDDANLSFKSTQLVGAKLAAGGGTNILYIVDTENKNVSQKIISQGGDIKLIREADGNLIVFTNQTKLLKSDKGSADFTEIKINWNNVSLTDFQVYNNNLYAIDHGIYKFSGAGKNFAAPQNWVKDADGADLTQASAIAIDGNVYVLTQSGNLYKFYAGKRENLTTPTIEPALSNNATLFTTKDSKNIYILDSANKRVVVLDKTGALIKQLLFDSITDEIASLAINKEENQVFMTTKNKIYQTNFTK